MQSNRQCICSLRKMISLGTFSSPNVVSSNTIVESYSAFKKLCPAPDCCTDAPAPVMSQTDQVSAKKAAKSTENPIFSPFLSFCVFREGYQTRRKRTFAHLIIIGGRSENHSIDVFSTVFFGQKLGKPTSKFAKNVEN